MRIVLTGGGWGFMMGFVCQGWLAWAGLRYNRSRNFFDRITG